MTNLELKAERTRLGLTQNDMASLLSISVPSYCQKENGNRPFTQKEISIIAEKLSLSPERLVLIFFTPKLNANDKLSDEQERAR